MMYLFNNTYVLVYRHRFSKHMTNQHRPLLVLVTSTSPSCSPNATPSANNTCNPPQPTIIPPRRFRSSSPSLRTEYDWGYDWVVRWKMSRDRWGFGRIWSPLADTGYTTEDLKDLLGWVCCWRSSIAVTAYNTTTPTTTKQQRDR